MALKAGKGLYRCGLAVTRHPLPTVNSQGRAMPSMEPPSRASEPQLSTEASCEAACAPLSEAGIFAK